MERILTTNTHSWRYYWAVFVISVTTGCTPVQMIANGVFATAPEWIFDTPDPIISTPAVEGDTIILRAESQVYALDGTTRSVLWTVKSSGTIYDTAPPLIADGIVLVPDTSNPLAAYGLKSGTLLWRNCARPDQLNCAQASQSQYVDFMIAAQDIVLVSNSDGHLTAYVLQTGVRVWDLQENSRGGSSITVDGDMVYSERLEQGITVQLLALDLETGTVHWQQNVGGALGRKIAKDGVLYYTKGLDTSSLVIAIARNRKLLWYAGFQGAPNSIYNYLALDTDMVFVAGNSLNAFSTKTGKALWHVPDMVGLQQPVVFGKILLVRDDHFLYAFDKLTGKGIGRLSLEVAPGSYNVELNPAVYGDLVLIPVGKARLAAYRLATP